MFRLKRIKFHKIGKTFKKIPRVLGEHAFLTFLSFIFLILIFGGLVFYKYNILVLEKKLESLGRPLYLNEKILQEVLQIWQERQERFEKAETKEYPDLFRAMFSVPAPGE